MAQSRPSTEDLSQPSAVVETEPMSLKELVRGADRIFIGKVTNVSVKREPLVARSEVQVEVQLVSFQLLKVIKDETRKLNLEQTYQVRQLKSISRNVVPGETLLWYLPPESKLGLSQPVGVSSGDFSIRKSNGKQVAINYAGNKGLFDPDAVAEVQTQVNAIAQALPNPADQKNFAAELRIQFEKLKEATDSGKPANLDVLVAGTKMFVGEQ
jgi:hypothetical protein